MFSAAETLRVWEEQSLAVSSNLRLKTHHQPSTCCPGLVTCLWEVRPAERIQPLHMGFTLHQLSFWRAPSYASWQRFIFPMNGSAVLSNHSLYPPLHQHGSTVELNSARPYGLSELSQQTALCHWSTFWIKSWRVGKLRLDLKGGGWGQLALLIILLANFCLHLWRIKFLNLESWSHPIVVDIILDQMWWTDQQTHRTLLLAWLKTNDICAHPTSRATKTQWKQKAETSNKHLFWFQMICVLYICVFLQVSRISCAVQRATSSTLCTTRWIKTWSSPCATTSSPRLTTRTWLETSSSPTPRPTCMPGCCSPAAAVWKVSKRLNQKKNDVPIWLRLFLSKGKAQV